MVQLSTLERYAAEFRLRVLQHPDVWHLATHADMRCRIELWAEEKQSMQHMKPFVDTCLIGPGSREPWQSTGRCQAGRQSEELCGERYGQCKLVSWCSLRAGQRGLFGLEADALFQKSWAKTL